jgi:hypothetical protein
MAGKGLTDSEVLAILYKSDESFSDSSNDSVSSSDNEIDDVAVVLLHVSYQQPIHV